MNERSFELTLSKITAGTVDIIMKCNGWDENYAMQRFISSVVYRYLEDEKTKLWYYSPTLLAQLFEDERSGMLKFPEV